MNNLCLTWTSTISFMIDNTTADTVVQLIWFAFPTLKFSNRALWWVRSSSASYIENIFDVSGMMLYLTSYLQTDYLENSSRDAAIQVMVDSVSSVT